MDGSVQPLSRGELPRREVMQTPDEVAAMLRLKALGWGIKRIARELGCSHMTVRHYVAQGGSNSNPGTQTAPFGTIRYAASFLQPGDTLYIRGGTYTEGLIDVVPSGTSWSSPVTVSAYPGESVTLRPGSGDAVVRFQNNNASYIIVNGLTIDASGVLVDGTKVSGVVDLRNSLLRYSDTFTRVVTEKLLTYALGRGVEDDDMPLVRSIVRQAAPGKYRFSSLALGIVKSPAFQMNMKPVAARPEQQRASK